MSGPHVGQPQEYYALCLGRSESKALSPIQIDQSVYVVVLLRRIASRAGIKSIVRFESLATPLHIQIEQSN